MATSSAEKQGKLPYTVKVDPYDALELAQQGASLLLLETPPGTLLGCDLHILSVGPLFKGLKMIPPGPHFVYYSAASRHGANHPFFTGFFIHPNPGDVLVRRWDPESETFVEISDPDEEERYRASVRKFDMDRHLGPYDLHHFHVWKRLISHVTPEVVDRFEPVASNISVMHEAEFAETLPQTAAERRMNHHLTEQRQAFLNQQAAMEAQAMVRRVQGGMVLSDENFVGEGEPGKDYETCMEIDSGMQRALEINSAEEAKHDTVKQTSGRCFYTRLPQLVKRRGVTGSVLTMLNVDKSAELDYLLENCYGGSEDVLLGELQFSFIAFLMGQSLESFWQWKSIVCLMLSCDEAPLTTHTQLFIKFLDAVCFQLQIGLRKKGLSTLHTTLTDTMMDESWISEDSLLRSRFKEFYQIVTEAHPVDGDLLKQTRRLKGLLESAIGWSFDQKEKVGINDEDDDEYAPVIVSESELSGYI